MDQKHGWRNGNWTSDLTSRSSPTTKNVASDNILTDVAVTADAATSFPAMDIDSPNTTINIVEDKNIPSSQKSGREGSFGPKRRHRKVKQFHPYHSKLVVIGNCSLKVYLLKLQISTLLILMCLPVSKSWF